MLLVEAAMVLIRNAGLNGSSTDRVLATYRRFACPRRPVLTPEIALASMC